MHEKRVAVRTENERDVETLRVRKSLQHPRSDRVLVVFSLDDGDRKVRTVKEQVVGALTFATCNETATNDDLPVRERVLPTPPIPSPARTLDGWRDVPIA